MTQEEGTAIFCPKCGKPVFIQEKKCPNCKYELTEEDIKRALTKGGSDTIKQQMDAIRIAQVGRNKFTKDNPYVK